MSLIKRVGVSLDTITPSKETTQRLLASATRSIGDAKVKAISLETRFCSAYAAIRTLADLGLHVNGYRVLTSRPGHHHTAIQTLPLTLGVDMRTVARLDHMRKQRNVTEYSGDIVTRAALYECLSLASRLNATALNWLKKHRRDFL